MLRILKIYIVYTEHVEVLRYDYNYIFNSFEYLLSYTVTDKLDQSVISKTELLFRSLYH